MSLKSYYFILFVIALSSTVSTALLYYYLSPELDPHIALSLMATALFLPASSILSLLIFFIKKVYYRGEVYLSTMSASIRQSVFLVIGGIMVLLLSGLSLTEPKLFLMVWAALGCLEIMFQAIE